MNPGFSLLHGFRKDCGQFYKTLTCVEAFYEDLLLELH